MYFFYIYVFTFVHILLYSTGNNLRAPIDIREGSEGPTIRNYLYFIFKLRSLCICVYANSKHVLIGCYLRSVGGQMHKQCHC